MIWYSILMLITIAAAIQIAWHVWGKQEMHGRAAIMIAMLAIVVWAISTITQLLIPSIIVLHVGTIVSAVMRTIYGSTPSDLDTIIQSADNALYAAKARGRNQVQLAGKIDEIRHLSLNN